MATFKSNLYGAIPSESTASGAVTSTNTYVYKGPYGDRAGGVTTVEGTFTIPTGIATTDTNDLFPLPAGARLTSYLHFWEDLGGTMTGEVLVDTTQLKTGIAMGTAQAATATTALSAAECATAWSVNATAEKNVRLDFSTITTAIPGAVYNFTATYAMAS